MVSLQGHKAGGKPVPAAVVSSSDKTECGRLRPAPPPRVGPEDDTPMLVFEGNCGGPVEPILVPIALEEGLKFAIREGGHTVGAGVVTKILE